MKKINENFEETYFQTLSKLVDKAKEKGSDSFGVLNDDGNWEEYCNRTHRPLDNMKKLYELGFLKVRYNSTTSKTPQKSVTLVRKKAEKALKNIKEGRCLDIEGLLVDGNEKVSGGAPIVKENNTVGEDTWNYHLCDDGGCSTEWDIPLLLEIGTVFTHTFGKFEVSSYSENGKDVSCDKI